MGRRGIFIPIVFFMYGTDYFLKWILKKIIAVPNVSPSAQNKRGIGTDL
jgi:hypothetical protein